MYITAQMLRNATKDTLAIFEAVLEKEWPNGREVDLATMTRAVELGVDQRWFAHNYLSAPAQATYQEARNVAKKALAEAYSIALETYRRTKNDKGYYCDRARAWEAYQQTTMTALLLATGNMASAPE